MDLESYSQRSDRPTLSMFLEYKSKELSRLGTGPKNEGVVSRVVETLGKSLSRIQSTSSSTRYEKLKYSKIFMLKNCSELFLLFYYFIHFLINFLHLAYQNCYNTFKTPIPSYTAANDWMATVIKVIGGGPECVIDWSV